MRAGTVFVMGDGIEGVDWAAESSAIRGESGYWALAGDGGEYSGVCAAAGGSDLEFTRRGYSGAEALSHDSRRGDDGLGGVEGCAEGDWIWAVFVRGALYSHGKAA